MPQHYNTDIPPEVEAGDGKGKTLLTRRNQRRVLVGIKNASGMFIKHTFDSETGLAKKGAGYQTLTSGGGKGQMTKNIRQRLKDILL